MGEFFNAPKSSLGCVHKFAVRRHPIADGCYVVNMTT
jgi:hypothetical protein